MNRSDEDTNPMGNIKAKLSVSYKKGTVNGKEELTLLSATSSYKVLIREGVTAKSSKLYYNVEGDIYKDGVNTKKKIMGFTKKFTSPTFNAVKLMGASYSVRNAINAGVTYTLYCTRGVEIEVRVRFA